MKHLLGSNSAYPTSTRHSPSGGAGGAVARLQVASMSFSKASSSAPAAASLIEVATRTRTIYKNMLSPSQCIKWKNMPSGATSFSPNLAGQLFYWEEFKLRFFTGKHERMVAKIMGHRSTIRHKLRIRKQGHNQGSRGPSLLVNSIIIIGFHQL